MYRVVLVGMAEGADRAEVVRKLAALFKVSETKAAKILDTPDFAVKIQVPKDEAEEYQKALEGAGARCRIEQRGIGSMDVSPSAPVPQPAVPEEPRKIMYVATTVTEVPEEPAFNYLPPLPDDKKKSDNLLRLLVPASVGGVVLLVLVMGGIIVMGSGRKTETSLEDAARRTALAAKPGDAQKAAETPEARPRKFFGPALYQCTREDGSSSELAILPTGYYVDARWSGAGSQRSLTETVFGTYSVNGSEFTLAPLGSRSAKVQPGGADNAVWKALDTSWLSVEFQMTGATGKATIKRHVMNGNDILRAQAPENCEIPASNAALEGATKFLAGVPKHLLPTAEVSSARSIQDKGMPALGGYDSPVNVPFGRDAGGSAIYTGYVEKGSPTYFRLQGAGYGRRIEAKVHSPDGDVTLELKSSRKSFLPRTSLDFVPSDIDYLIAIKTESASAPYRLTLSDKDDFNAQAAAEAAIKRLSDRYQELQKRCPPLASQSFNARFSAAVAHLNDGENSIKQLGRYNIATLTQFENAGTYAEEGMDRVEEDMRKADRVCPSAPAGAPQK